MDRQRILNSLQSIADSEELETRWLFTLAGLELTGARKIARAIEKMPVTLDMLKHWKDEVRHAYAFRQLAESQLKQTGGQLYIARNDALHYFHSMDRSAAEILEDRGLRTPLFTYLLTTMLIEERAMMIYPLYRSVTKRHDVKQELSEIIQEEATHKKPLEDLFYNECSIGEDIFKEASAMESGLFSRFWERVDAKIS